jgi:prepilin-type N-terminal cleavage/methylation domain-containing protein
MRPTTHKQSGFSLVEILMAVAIGVAVTGAVWASYNIQDRDAKVQQTISDVSTIVDAANAIYSNNQSYQTNSSTNTAVLPTIDSVVADAGGPLLPSLFGSGANTSNYWSGTWSLSQVNAANANEIKVDLTAVPDRECVDLVQGIAPKAYLVYVNGALVGMDPAPTTQSSGRSYARPSSAATNCQSTGTTGNTVSMRFLKPFNYSSFRSTPYNSPMSAAELANLTPAYNLYTSQMATRETLLAAVP